MSPDRNRTVVVGFDALDFRYVDRFIDDLPNFEALRSRGVEAPLRSTFPPWTASAWPSMFTGVDPSHHGVYGFFSYDGYPTDSETVTRNDVDSPALWNYLTARDVPTVAMNLPVTYPAEPVTGVVTPGYLAPEDAPGYPESVRDTLSDAIGEEYRIYARGETADDPDTQEAGFLDLIDMRRRAAVALLEEYDWRLAVLQVQKTDTVFHSIDDEAAHGRVYEAADEFLGSVLDTVGDDTNVVVCSDHGMGKTDGYKIYLNEILKDAGYVESTSEGSQQSLKAVKPDLVGDGGASAASDDQLAARAVSTASSAMRKLGLSPGKAYVLAERFGPGERIVKRLPDDVREAFRQYVDWAASTAYCRSGTRMGVRVNLEGRDPDGVVPPDEYEAVRDEIISLLEDLETPAGEPAFEFVARREAVYEGPYADAADDILFRPTGMNHALSTKLYGQAFVPIDQYNHKWDGVFVGAGPDFDSAASPGTVSLTDVAPVVMSLLGQPVPERMTGEVPVGLLDGETARDEYSDVAFGARESGGALDESDDAVTERLEDLGYL